MAPLGGIAAAVASHFFVLHNTLRCMHNAPMLEWDYAVASPAQRWAARGVFEHSDSYRLPPPAGPSGENLALGHVSAEAAIQAWYDEYELWRRGRQDSFSSRTGHFTAMIWKGAKSLGCGVNFDARRMYVCHYKGDDTIGPNTPNLSGYFKEMVLPLDPDKSIEQCKREAEIAWESRTTESSQKALFAGEYEQSTLSPSRTGACGDNRCYELSTALGGGVMFDPACANENPPKGCNAVGQRCCRFCGSTASTTCPAGFTTAPTEPSQHFSEADWRHITKEITR